MLGSKLHFAFIAGIFAALGSVFGKLSGSADLIDRFLNILNAVSTDKKVTVIALLQLLTFSLMLLCNASVWSFYVKALNSSSSSLPATVISTATNYILSALCGMLLFEEVTGLVWWTGTALVITGLAIIAKNAEKSQPTFVSERNDDDVDKEKQT